MPLRSVAAKNAVAAMTVAVAAFVTVSLTNGFLIRAQAPPAGAPARRIRRN